MQSPKASKLSDANVASLKALLSGIRLRMDDQEFFQALRLIANCTNSVIGQARSPSEDPVRLRPHASVGFPGSEIADVKLGDGSASDPSIVEATFFGLYGPNGALPLHYTQLILDRVRESDHALREFLDLFNHRLLTLFYRAWEKQHFPVEFETSRRSGSPDLFSKMLWSFTGFGADSLRDSQELDDSAWLYFAGIKALRGPRAEGLEQMLRTHFTVPVEVVPFHAQWLSVPGDSQSVLGFTSAERTLFNQLGVNTVVGSRVWSVEHRFRVCIGPLSYSRFKEFTPSGTHHRSLAQMIRTYVGPMFDFDIQIVLRREEVPKAQLAADHSASRLGWNTWLGDWRNEFDSGDAVFVAEGLPTDVANS